MIYKDNFTQEILKMIKEAKNNGKDSNFGAVGEGDEEYISKDLQEELIRIINEILNSEEVDDTDKSDKGEDGEEINIVTLTDERGEKVEFEFLSYVNYGKKGGR